MPRNSLTFPTPLWPTTMTSLPDSFASAIICDAAFPSRSFDEIGRLGLDSLACATAFLSIFSWILPRSLLYVTKFSAAIAPGSCGTVPTAIDSETFRIVIWAEYFSVKSRAKSNALMEFSEPSTATRTCLITVSPQGTMLVI